MKLFIYSWPNLLPNDFSYSDLCLMCFSYLFRAVVKDVRDRSAIMVCEIKFGAIEILPVYSLLKDVIGVETAALTFRTKQYSTSCSCHICYGKRFYNDFFLNHTIALVNNFLKLLNCMVIETVLDLVKKRINYFNSLLSTRKRTILTSSRTVLNAMIAMHVNRQL